MANTNWLSGKKTIIGVVIVLIPVIAGFLGFDVSEAFPVQFARAADETFIILGSILALYGRMVATGPAWFKPKNK